MKRILMSIIIPLFFCFTINITNVAIAGVSNNPPAKSLSDIKASSLAVGDIVLFGSYEQDNITSNGKEPIIWIILEKESEKCLLFSYNIIDFLPFHDKMIVESTAWRASTLHTWLNKTFFDIAFTSYESSSIIPVKYNLDDGEYSTTNRSNSMTDKVFLLSDKEVKKYLGYDITAYGTEYAIKKDRYYPESYNGKMEWWLRSGYSLRFDAVRVDGSISGLRTNEDAGIRPAIWVNVSKISSN